MAGHIKPISWTDRKGVKQVRHRARVPNPLKGGTAQIERRFRTRAQAQDWLLGMQHASRTGAFINPAHADGTVAALADEWRGTWADLEPKTKAGYESILNKHVLPRFGPARLSAVTPDRVQAFVNDLASEKLPATKQHPDGHTRAPNTVRRIYTVMRQVFALAVERRYLTQNPCDPVRLPKKRSTKRDRVYLTPQEVRALAEAMPTETQRVATYVAAYCGLRAGELWALRRDDVDLLHGTLRVDEALKDINTTSNHLTASEKGLIFGAPKTAAGLRTMTLPAPLLQLLKTYLATPLPSGPRPDALIFTTPSATPIRHGLFYARVFKDARKALPTEKQHCRWHDLRHTAASLTLAVTPNLHLVKERLGHEDVRTTINLYGHLLPSVDAALAEGLGALWATTDSNVRELVRSQ